jgi:hypothetical protein
MTNKRVLQVLLGVLYLVLTYGIVGPWLISQASTLALALGVVVVFVIPAFVLVNIKKFLK